MRVLITPILPPSQSTNTFFALIAYHFGENSFVDVLVSNSGKLKVSTIVGTKPSYFSYVILQGGQQVNIVNASSTDYELKLSILVFGGTIA